MRKLDRITCGEMFRRLDDYLDRALAADELRRVEAHLASCADCAREYRFDASVIAAVRSRLQGIASPADLQPRLSARLGEPPQKS